MIKEFKFQKDVQFLSIKEISNLTNGQIIGDADLKISSVSSIEKGTSTDISFLNGPSYLDKFMSSKSGACFIKKKYIDKAPKGMTLIVVKDPYLSFAMTSSKIFPLPKFEEKIGAITDIDKTAKIGKNCHISNFVTIGKNVIIGDNVYIGPNTTIYDDVIIGSSGYIYSNVSIKYSVIGDNFIIHDGAKIGQDGFGFAPNPSGHVKIPQIGGVIIANNVEIGANSCIDRGALNDTVISEGTKIDNMVQIAHNVIIGKHCFLASGVGIAGSSVIEDYVSIGGGAGIAPNVVIGSGTQISPMSGVAHNVEKGSILIGTPAMNFTTFWRIQVLLKRFLKSYYKKN